MLAEERRHKLLQALHKRGSLSVSEASGLLQVSRMTVHRDLDQLAAAGRLRKVHGGAVEPPEADEAAAAQRSVARPFTERAPEAAQAKRRIAAHLARLIAGGRNLALDASSTVFPLARALPPCREHPAVFIVTNGLPLFQALCQRQAGFRVALTGGEPHPRTGSLVGPFAEKGLEGLRFDFAVVSAAGLMEDERGVYDSTPEGIAVKQAFLRRARVKVLALDSGKFNFLAPYLLGRLDDFDVLVTEYGARKVRKAGRSACAPASREVS